MAAARMTSHHIIRAARLPFTCSTFVNRRNWTKNIKVLFFNLFALTPGSLCFWQYFKMAKSLAGEYFLWNIWFRLWTCLRQGRSPCVQADRLRPALATVGYSTCIQKIEVFCFCFSHWPHSHSRLRVMLLPKVRQQKVWGLHWCELCPQIQPTQNWNQKKSQHLVDFF